jgi:predicted enzyme related to lactoylglutathione lyase
MLAFIKVPEPKTAKNRVHVDLAVPDLAAGVERAVALGATRHGDFDEASFVWTTFTDPEGNEFDIVLEPPA